MRLGSAEHKQYLASALQFIGESRRFILGYWDRGRIHGELKGDKSFVTEADIGAEKLLRQLITERFPAHGIIGEELPTINPDAPFLWAIDPIDGTQNFVAGIRTFGTFLGLMYEGKPIVGLIDHPVLGVCYSGGPGLGAFVNGEEIIWPADRKATLDENDIVSLSPPAGFLKYNQELLLHELMRFHPVVRMYYDCFSCSQAVQGSTVCGFEISLKVWETVAIQALIESAGGQFLVIHEWDRIRDWPHVSALFGRPEIIDLLHPIVRQAWRSS
jgi:fructose-1,6-bisphosphatase/inositol monophosphatase family enzyme